MFTTKLKIRKYISKLLVSHASEKISSQVVENSIFKIIKSILWKAIILLFFGFIVILPFYIMIVISVSSNEYLELSKDRFSVWWPDTLSWGNFAKAWDKGYGKALLGSMGITAVSVVFKIFFSMFLGYAFSLKQWRFKRTIWAILLSLLLLPDSALLIGQYRVIVVLEWNTGYYLLAALSMPYVASIVSAFMYRNAFEQIPDRVKEAAMIDGCSGLRYLIKVAMPMVSPTTWTVVILTAFSAWNALLWPLLLLSPNDFINVLNIWAVDIGRADLDGSGIVQVDLGTKMAGSILVIIPMFIVFIFLRKKIMSSVGRQGKAIKG